MSQPSTESAWPVLEPDDPPLDFTRENAVYEKVMLKKIGDAEVPEYIAHVDVNHPSFRKLD
jgi:hypothetical protein